MIQTRTARVAPEKQGPIAPLSAVAFLKREFAMETEMVRKTYFEKLRDPRWQRMRLKIMERADFKCEECGTGDDTLNVHHRLYRKGADPWDYAEAELRCLCETCHEKEHNARSRLNEAIAKLDPYYIDQIVGFAEGTLFLQLAEAGAADHILEIYSLGHVTGVEASLGVDEIEAGELLKSCKAHGEGAARRYTISARQLFDVFYKRLTDGRADPDGEF